MISEIIQVIGVVSVPIWSFLLLKYTLNVGKTKVKEEIQEFLRSEEGQKVIYGLGVLIGSGAKTGLGLKGSGKLKFEDIIMQGLGSFFESMMSAPTQSNLEKTSEISSIAKRTPEMR